MHAARESAEVLAAPARSSLVAFELGPRPLAEDGNGERVAAWMHVLSYLGVVAIVGVQAVRMSRDAPASALVRPAIDAALVADGHIELAEGGLTVRRGERWRTVPTIALESIDVAPPFVVGRTERHLVALDAETGGHRFAWNVPEGEAWAHAPSVHGSCLVTSTVLGTDGVIRCLALDSGVERWQAAIEGGTECIDIAGASGAIVVRCRGWTSTLDERDGSSSVAPHRAAARACGRYELVELAPPLDTTYDPEAAQRRTLALRDGDTIVWQSRAFVHARRIAPICRAGHHFVPLVLRDDGGVVSALWIIDAATGTTTATHAFIGEPSADRIDAERMLVLTDGGAVALRWRAGDAGAGLARVLGALP